ncbi:MAG: cystathionine beta-lyase [Enterobacteriaceae bacterium]
MKYKNIETTLTNYLKNKKYTQSAINPIIQRASSIIFKTLDQKKKNTNLNKNNLFYGRNGTITHFALQKLIVKLEKGFGCILYPCGVAAITNSIFSMISYGENIIITESAYEMTQNFCKYLLNKMNVTTTWIDVNINKQKISKIIKKNTKILVIESPGSITMDIYDVPYIIESVKKINPKIITILDNTWSAGILFPAFKFGVDISLQSGTKYMIGHSDYMLGVAVSNKKCWKKLKKQSYLMGQTIDADTAYIAIRGLRTLKLRLKQHERSSIKVAKWLSKRPEVLKVNHPALSNFEGNKIFKRDFNGSNGLLSFIFKKRLKKKELSLYINKFKYFKIAYSWGGYESLILPIQPKEMAILRPINKLKFKNTIIRLHIGLENVDDLIEDLSNGFNRISKT